MARQPTLLIRGGQVVTVDQHRRVIDEGAILVRGSRIEAVGGPELAETNADEVIDARGCIVTPGLINTHQHHWYTLMKGLGNGMLLERWIKQLLVPAGAVLAVDDHGVGSLLACLQMIRTGTTQCVNQQTVVNDHETTDRVLAGVRDSGMRQIFAKEIRPIDGSVTKALDQAEAIGAAHRQSSAGRIDVALTIESTGHFLDLGVTSEELILRGHELATRLDAIIVNHVAAGTMSRDEGYLRQVLKHGRTDIEYLHSLGVLDERWLLAHAIHVRDRDIELIASGGAAVAHTPTSEATRGGGITPVARMMAAGVNVVLGSDGPMVDVSVDMVEQMKVARLMQNQLHLDPWALSPETTLEMATIRAAEAIGQGHEIGSLEPGKKADIAIFDVSDVLTAVCPDPVTSLVHIGRGADARWVLVDGEVLLRDGTFTRVSEEDLAQLLVQAGQVRAGIVERGGLAELPIVSGW